MQRSHILDIRENALNHREGFKFNVEHYVKVINAKKGWSWNILNTDIKFSVLNTPREKIKEGDFVVYALKERCNMSPINVWGWVHKADNGELYIAYWSRHGRMDEYGYWIKERAYIKFISEIRVLFNKIISEK